MSNPYSGRGRPHGTGNSLNKLFEMSGGPDEDFSNKFGRLFKPHNDQPTEEQINALAATMRNSAPDLNPNVAIGMAFFGQFIDHDTTLDATSVLGRPVPRADDVLNFRTPALDLDCVYQNGPEVSPYIFNGHKLNVGTPDNPRDVPRMRQTNVAVIGDPRNDENIFISQLQSLFIRFHNFIIDQIDEGKIHIEEGETPVEAAIQLMRHSYQWTVVNEFLPSIVEPQTLAPMIEGFNQGELPKPIKWDRAPNMPVEFSAACFRFGHSLIREHYKLNSTSQGDLFTFPPFSPVEERNNIDWSFMFDLSKPEAHANQIDTKLVAALFDLPFIPQDHNNNLASRNMIRGCLTYLLPSGEQVAKELKQQPIPLRPEVRAAGMSETPLWYYTLAEAEAHNGKLGPVGGTIVSGVLLQLLLGDSASYINTNPGFSPAQAFGYPEGTSLFTIMADSVG